MSRVATILLICFGIIACPLVCRSGQCCQSANELSACSSCCCDAADCDSSCPHPAPKPCEKQCLCGGALVADLGAELPAPELSSIEPVVLTSAIDDVENLTIGSPALCGTNPGACLNVRLLV